MAKRKAVNNINLYWEIYLKKSLLIGIEMRLYINMINKELIEMGFDDDQIYQAASGEEALVKFKEKIIDFFSPWDAVDLAS